MLGISPRTLQRWREHGGVKADARQQAAQGRVPANKLSEHERQRIVAVANSEAFAPMPPSQIVPALADRGLYIASESSFYRVLREADQLAHRGKAKAPKHRRPTPLKATAPNQLWSWDITYLATTVKGMFFYLYLIMDVYSRKIVGWEVFETESAEQAADVFHKAYLREGYRRPDPHAALGQRRTHERRHHASDVTTTGRHALAEPPLGEQRQPVFRGLVQNIEISSRLSRQALRYRRRGA